MAFDKNRDLAVLTRIAPMLVIDASDPSRTAIKPAGTISPVLAFGVSRDARANFYP
jgi:hypothetical protein